MEAIIESYLAEYPSIQMVLDVHRDAVEDQAGFPAALSCKLDGEDYARLMLVVGTDEGGLEHPGWQENLANAPETASAFKPRRTRPLPRHRSSHRAV